MMSSQPSKDCEAIYDYTRKNVPMSEMLIGPIQGSFLQFLLRSIGAKRVLEIGCFTGYSALTMAEALPESGELITLDLEPQTTEIAQSFWNKSPHGKKIKALVGPALSSLEKIKGPFDFIFIDADKENYPNYFEKARTLLTPQGLIGLDNALRGGDVLKKNADPGTEAIRKISTQIAKDPMLTSCLLPIRDGLLLVKKL